jgi:pyrroloquinoline quinone biosynthesis protein B
LEAPTSFIHFLTHAHFGHVDGLGLLGKETMNAHGLNLHVSSSMFHLMEETPQWALMLAQGVFSEHVFMHDDRIILSDELRVEPVHVPHRAELSDMHAFVVRGPNHSLLYLPDHDDWDSTLERHQCTSIREWLNVLEVDIALIDGTFWDMDELPALRQSNVPHPPVCDTLDRLGNRTEGDPEILFIHLNHTNPLHDENSEASEKVQSMGWGVAKQGQQFTL